MGPHFTWEANEGQSSEVTYARGHVKRKERSSGLGFWTPNPMLFALHTHPLLLPTAPALTSFLALLQGGDMQLNGLARAQLGL